MYQGYWKNRPSQQFLSLLFYILQNIKYKQNIKITRKIKKYKKNMEYKINNLKSCCERLFFE
jgi:hypothetical protein